MSALDTYMEEGRRIGVQQGIEQGIQEGKELGIQEGKREIQLIAITNLRKTGMNDEQIRQILAIDMVEWEQLWQN